jgi:glycosyltransferase involved in cell wall biosynthesis
MDGVGTAKRPILTGERRLAITSVFGPPLDPKTWSGAPFNLAQALEGRGVSVAGIDTGPAPIVKLRLAVDHLAHGGNAPLDGDRVRRDLLARRLGAAASEAANELVVLHTGTLDLPPPPNGAARHFLYCDHTWDLSLRHRPNVDRLDAAYVHRVEELEQRSYDSLAHIFTFGDFVRDNLIGHYGVAPDRVTTVGSGMGAVAPYHGAKNYTRPKLLFVCKHLFAAKGGFLLLEAFRRVRARRPEAVLEIVAKSPPAGLAREAGVSVHEFLPWNQLQQLFRTATLLVQPMLNDPWGQVYLEAMVSRTPPVGLNRNGLPEIVEGGRHGFLVPHAAPQALADTILAALDDPRRLAAMGESGQRSVLERFTWDKVAAAVAARIFDSPDRFETNEDREYRYA